MAVVFREQGVGYDWGEIHGGEAAINIISCPMWGSSFIIVHYVLYTSLYVLHTSLYVFYLAIKME